MLNIGLMPSTRISLSRKFQIAIGGYALLLVAAVLILRSYSHPPLWLAVAFGLVLTALAAFAAISSYRDGRRTDGLEKLVVTESAGVAFFVTMAAAAGYALMESLAEAPQISMWWVWVVGMATWGITSIVMTRRMI